VLGVGEAELLLLLNKKSFTVSKAPLEADRVCDDDDDDGDGGGVGFSGSVLTDSERGVETGETDFFLFKNTGVLLSSSLFAALNNFSYSLDEERDFFLFENTGVLTFSLFNGEEFGEVGMFNFSTFLVRGVVIGDFA
jgi:hypothetical protein